MSFNCFKLHAKCQAGCCGIVPIDAKVYKANEHKRTRPVIQEIPFKDAEILPHTMDKRCCFLGEDLRCQIFNDRPQVCKDYGNEEHTALTCAYQNKDGKERSKQAKKRIKREHKKYVEGALNREKQRMKRAMKHQEFINKLKLKDDGDKQD